MYPPAVAPDRPDWRWARAVELAQYSNTEASARLQREDELIARAYKFKRSLDRGTGDVDDPELFMAHLYYMNRPNIKFQFEGWLISQSADYYISLRMGRDHYPEGVVRAYHDYFFSVRPWFTNKATMIDVVFNGDTHYNSVHNDDGFKLRVAWLLGAEAFDQVVYGGISPDTRKKMLELMRGTLICHLTQVSMAALRKHEMPEALRGSTELLNNQPEQDEGGDGEYTEAVGKFFENMGISVADPTDDRNLSLPAEEARPALEYEVVTNDAGND